MKLTTFQNTKDSEELIMLFGFLLSFIFPVSAMNAKDALSLVPPLAVEGQDISFKAEQSSVLTLEAFDLDTIWNKFAANAWLDFFQKENYSSDVIDQILKKGGPQKSLELWGALNLGAFEPSDQEKYLKIFYEAFGDHEFTYSALKNAKAGFDTKYPFHVKKLIVDIEITSEGISKLLQIPIYSLIFALGKSGKTNVCELANSLKKNTSLTILNLSNNNIGDEGAKAIANSLEKNTGLTTLELIDNNIGDNGARELGEALRKNKTLTTLKLSLKYISFNLFQSLKNEFGIRMVW